jgi:DnaJ-class molecular chaperone
MKRDTPLDLYQILGLKDFSNLELIKSAYKKLALRFHPDRQGGDSKKMMEINIAKSFLVQNKAAYDIFLKEQKYNYAPVVKTYTFVVNPAWQNFWSGDSSDVWTGWTSTSSTGF